MISQIINNIIRNRKKKYIDKLIENGLKLGQNVFLNDGFFLDPAHCHLITIEDDVVFGPNVSCFAHDASSLKIIGKTLISHVHISKNVFIGAGTIILPGVTIGAGSIIAAGSVVTKSVPELELWGGVPAIKKCTIEEYKNKLLGLDGVDFLYSEYSQKNLNLERRENQIKLVKQYGIGFMKK
jgi:maltose O-acetyltransferase